MENDEEKTDLADHIHSANFPSETVRVFLADRSSYKALGTITLYTDKANYEMNIQEDITSKELSDIMIILFLSLHAHENYDWGYIIEDKKLTRHFNILNKES